MLGTYARQCGNSFESERGIVHRAPAEIKTFSYNSSFFIVDYVKPDVFAVPDILQAALHVQENAPVAHFPCQGNMTARAIEALQADENVKIQMPDISEYIEWMRQNPGILIRDGNRMMACWNIHLQTEKLRVEKFAEILAVSDLSPARVGAVIAELYRDNYIGKVVAEAIIAYLIRENPRGEKKIIKSSGFEERELSQSIEQMYLHTGAISRDQKLRKLAENCEIADSQSVGLYDKDFLLGRLADRREVWLTITLNSMTNEAIKAFYSESGEHIEDEMLEILKTRFSLAADAHTYSEAQLAVELCNNVSSRTRVIPVTDTTHIKQVIKNEMSASEIFEQVMHIMCYDI